ncbi:kinase-like domain-containing protein [Kockovaella imperatae]|uniref:Kinase-like domain-containing protein n=1 Tax=Kockovaella imperatae TaxID=4999 RepID=A0A1Y1UEI9_9TREE|nr:kinase-like domain-containing protein [Kockovaella imperatae]ORX36463.1 kinase-like domain-containing protein [Kockovaella imperatae]
MSSHQDSAAPLKSLLLRPPSTVVSPPSPVDATVNHSQLFARDAEASRGDGGNDSEAGEAVTYDSPEEEEEEDDVSNGQRAGEAKITDRSHPKRHTESSAKSVMKRKEGDVTPIASQQLSASPQTEPTLLAPDAVRFNPNWTPFNSGIASGPSSRSASPSSPQFRMRGLHHRRTSSTHRVRETIAAQQIDTPDGQRMVNQYKIGRSLGKGGYAKVELAIDVGTGEQYAIKEFSKSRLHLQALQDKHKRASRGRLTRVRGSPKPPADDGKRKAGEDAGDPIESPLADDNPNGPWAPIDSANSEEDPLALIRREIAIMKKLDHPHLVSLFEAISVPNADALFLVLEYMPGGVLMEVKIGPQVKDTEPPFPVEQTREYFRQLVLGLEYLHANEVIHRDVKPDNILLSADREVVKLCDFGVSEMFVNQGDDRVKKEGGSPAFLSPESFTSQIHEVHGKAVDIWALGVTLYCMLTGGLPFTVENPLDLMHVVQNEQPPEHPEWDQNLRDLVHCMLDKNPETRASIETLRDQAWVTANGQEPMISSENNLFYLGSHVEEPTLHEITMAIASLRSVFTVVRAIQKFKRLGLHRLPSSGSQPHRSSTLSPRTDQTFSPHTTNPSLYSGSMDSYASHPSTESDVTAPTDFEDHYRPSSPSPLSKMGSIDTETERADSTPSRRVEAIDVEKANEAPTEEPDNVLLCDSPTSE